ncbi:MAG: hypothetical protein CMM87_06100 [Rickettsiales bacterium]|nr:hypothetical protein [Rickettsiales bacterium]|tara:strand:+ start:24583 stop:25149 length:567 start_codon:yes stop_codon:yes gene_type:complete
MKKNNSSLKRFNKLSSKSFLVILGFIAGYFAYEYYHVYPIPVASNKIEVCFTPGSPCENKIIQKIEEAQKEIHIQAFSFTSKPIFQALLRARERGVSIKVLSDIKQSQNRYSRIQDLKNIGVPVYFDKQPSYAHSKVMIIDDLYTITGSYNWTYSAQHRNSENVIFVESPEVSKKYTNNFYALLGKNG